MQDVVCYLISTTFESDKIGNQIAVETEIEVPIIKNEFVGMNEFYTANEQGLKPSLQLKISTLNYNNQQKLKYMDTIYTIIRTKRPVLDEIILICERKESDG
jgi:hypothetical protein